MSLPKLGGQVLGFGERPPIERGKFVRGDVSLGS